MLVAIVLKEVLRLVPIVVIRPMITTAISRGDHSVFDGGNSGLVLDKMGE